MNFFVMTAEVFARKTAVHGPIPPKIYAGRRPSPATLAPNRLDSTAAILQNPRKSRVSAQVDGEGQTLLRRFVRSHDFAGLTDRLRVRDEKKLIRCRKAALIA